MKIANSSVAMSAASKSEITASRQTRLEAWVGNRGREAALQPAEQPVSAELSEQARELAGSAAKSAPQGHPIAADAANRSGNIDAQLSDEDMRKIKLIEEFMYKLTGKRFKFLMLNRLKLKSPDNQTVQPAEAAEASPQKAGYGLIYDSEERRSEKQEMAFQAAGTVRTAGGRAIEFSVTLNMSREFQSFNGLHIRAGDAKVDPLVINIDSSVPQLSQRDFRFDLDSDGEEEQISRLLSGNGFLALDKNGDGAISNGSELFGPASGNGFSELASYDADGNGWIDENDSIYDKLRIWMDDGSGQMKLFALGQKGVGALYLGNAASAFEIRDAGNGSLGAVKSTGIFLRENGTAGTMQHIDLTV